MTDRTPVVDDDSRRYWEAVAAHRLEIQRCDRCGRFVFYPRALCPHCHGDRLTWTGIGGHGTVYSFTVSRRAATPSLAERVPYVVALVDLDEDVRMMSTIATDDVDAVRIGEPVTVAFEDLSDGACLPYFVLDRDTEQGKRP